MLLRIAIILAIAWIAWVLIRRALAPPAGREPGGEPPKFEPMARCAGCGVHVPRRQLDASERCERCRPA